MATRTILVVDDEPGIVTIARDYLDRAGFRVVTAGDGPNALRLARSERPSLLVLDLMLPGMDGLDVARTLRGDPATRALPIIMLTARVEEADRLIGLELGADDYITKPFSPRELVARVRAVLRRAGVERPEPLSVGAFAVDLERRTVSVAGGAATRLTPLELRLLQFLLARAGETVPAERLLLHVWGGRLEGDRQALKQLVHRLRQKLEPDPAAPVYLVTETGEGYRLETAAH